MSADQPFGWVFITALLSSGWRYTLVNGVLYLLLYKVKLASSSLIKIQSPQPDKNEVRHEIKWSVILALFSSLVAVLVYVLISRHYTKLYFDIHQHSITYYIFSFILYLLFIDMCAYWAHRLFHWGFLYRYIHSVHHHSTNPTPLANWSHHPLENTDVLFSVIFIMLVPLHISVLPVFGVLNIVYGAYTHSGYEILRLTPNNFWWGKWVITSRHHNLHHTKSLCNYGIVFNIWDRLMRTLDPAYDKLAQEPVMK